TPSIFNTQPIIDSQGKLTFEPYPNRYGTAIVTVVAIDDGEENNTSEPQYFTIVVSKFNNAPKITPIGTQAINEDTVMGPVAFTISDVDTPLNELYITYTSTNTDLVPLSNITIGGSGANRTITATPVPNGNGMTKIRITVNDNHPFFPKTASTEFVISVAAVNDPPQFTMGQNITTTRTPVVNNYVKWATNISPGPANESSQSVTFVLTASNPSLFSTQPSVNAIGTLTFKPAGVAGTTTVSIYAKDNGGTALGGVPFSQTNTFTITLY
ncbi:MAG TPA: hypothetical protein PLW02_13670, partial [Verrucomicrobiota bacterium]|nr:hypothetical protein [Verrucomicrobiota bacterium]